MKNFGIFKLGFKSLLKHRVFSILIIFILGIIFGTSLATTMRAISESSETIQKESNVMDGKVLASVELCKSNYILNGCEVPESYDAEVSKIAKKYDGETLGARITYVNEKNEKVYVILARAGKYLNHGKSFFISNQKIPVLKKAGEKIDENAYEALYEYENDETPFYIMMDETMTVMNFLFMNGFQMLSYEPLAIFDSEEAAYNFYKNESKEGFVVSQIFNKSLVAKSNYDKALKTTITTTILIIGIAITILVIFEVVISKTEAKNNRLYRTFGATKKDIFRIYLSSATTLFICSILVSPIFYLITTLILS